MAMTLADYINTLPLRDAQEWRDIAARAGDMDVYALCQQRVWSLLHTQVHDLSTMRVEAQLTDQYMDAPVRPSIR